MKSDTTHGPGAVIFGSHRTVSQAAITADTFAVLQ
jgi:hypothetical protein